MGRCLGLGERGLGMLFVIGLSVSRLKLTHGYTAWTLSLPEFSPYSPTHHR